MEKIAIKPESKMISVKKHWVVMEIKMSKEKAFYVPNIICITQNKDEAKNAFEKAANKLTNVLCADFDDGRVYNNDILIRMLSVETKKEAV